jgi:hypothetical protein
MRSVLARSQTSSNGSGEEKSEPGRGFAALLSQDAVLGEEMLRCRAETEDQRHHLHAEGRSRVLLGVMG